MKRYLTSLFILIVLIVFSIFVYVQKSTNIVLGIVNPTIIQVDLNANSLVDDGETICISNTESYNLELQSNNILLAYLADEYARNTLYLKPVKLKFNGKITSNCKEADVFIDGKNYSDLLYNEGFASKNGKIKQRKQDEKLKHARNLNLRILNLKSFKYHKLDCEYGIQSSDYIITPQKQLPKEAKPCKFCYVNRQNSVINTSNYQKEFVNNSIKLILTDFTTHLKPNSKCDTEPCKSILKEIQNAKKSIDMAIYGYNEIPTIYNALLDAKERGVKLRIVYDAVSDLKHYYKDTEKLLFIANNFKSDKNLQSDSLTNQLMHNKFVIIDGEIVITGSMNYSPTGLSGFNANNVIIMTSKDIAQLYTAEFEQMLSGKFHNEKFKLNKNRNFELSDSKIQVYFSPKDHTTDKIIPLINSAKKYIYIPTFLITHKNITEALIKAKERGVDIKVIIDANSTSTRNTKHALLRANGIQLKTENFAGKMHSKSMIIDDTYLILGSMNFSNSGENKNDENTIILENTSLAKYYKEFFMYLWNKIPDVWLVKNARAESKDSIGSCFDGVDNDFDGFIDNLDNGCE